MSEHYVTGAFRARATALSEVLGAPTAKSFAALRIHTVGDLLSHLPRRYLSGTELTDLGTLKEGEYAAIMARVRDVNVVMGSRQPRLEATVTDGHGTLRLTFFGRAHLVKYWQGELSKGVRGIFVGKVGSFQRQLQLAHPQFVMLDARGGIVGSSEEKRRLASLSQSGLVGMYPSTAKLATWQIAESVRLAISTLEGTADPWPEWVRAAAGVPDLVTAYKQVHEPDDMAEVERGTRRLQFDEAFATQLTMAHRRATNDADRAIARPPVAGGIRDAFLARLPYTLTGGQQRVIAEIQADLEATRPMQRLLQGDVGSGKTIAALIAMLSVVDTGGQTALLAPTEILATQHFNTITAMLGDLGAGAMLGAPDHATDVVLITGSQPAAQRRAAQQRVASGEAGIVIGTYALLAEQVQFTDLGLVVVDEQHRFGVEQRARLAAKAETTPHRLVLTATPIPRSVAMTVFGDLAVSTLEEVPSGRAGVSTTLVDAVRQPAWIARAWERMREEVARGRQGFVVVPRIDTPSDDPQALGVIDLAEHLRTGPLEGLRIGTVHGRQAAPEQAEQMAAFVRGELDVLVATTVIEVGVDVPNASMMVVTDADRFGIAQLHQLRGRIGRGEHPGVCLLFTRTDPEATAWERLAAVAATTDGFELAEVDLAQRREGDVLGSDQSGSRSGLRLLSVIDNADMIGLARELAIRAVEEDPELGIGGFRDAVTWTNSIADADWLDRA